MIVLLLLLTINVYIFIITTNSFVLYFTIAALCSKPAMCFSDLSTPCQW